MRIITIIFITLLFLSCNNNSPEEPGTDVPVTPAINYSTVNIFSHDTTSFTEGLLIHDGKLYECTGFVSEFPKTRSLFGEVDLTTGKIDVKAELDKTKYFGEGITFLHDKIYQLTYRTKIGFIYDAKTFKKTGDFTFPGDEGWGMTTDSSFLVMSDGTSALTYIDPVTMKAVKTITVTDENGSVDNVNELEYIKGFLYANIYTTNNIIKIDPATGKVLGKIDLGSLKNEQKTKFPGAMEMNGIAYDPATDKIFVTGKLWPNIYEINFSH